MQHALHGMGLLLGVADCFLLIVGPVHAYSACKQGDAEAVRGLSDRQVQAAQNCRRAYAWGRPLPGACQH